MMERKVEKMEAQGNSIILPQISDQHLLAKYYSLADVFVICSKKENFPTTCVEAQCCGTPVAGFDTGGTKEASVYGADDFVMQGDVAGLKDKVKALMSREHPDLAKRAYKAYTNENMTKQYMEEYDKFGQSKRVLLIDVNCQYTSTGKIVYEIFQSLKKKGREAAICYGRGDLIKEEGIYKFGLDWETNIHAGLARVTGYNGCFSYFSTKRLIDYIEQFKPDVIHIHELHAYFVNIKPLLQYIKEKKIKVVWTFHCEYMYTGKCGYAYECTKWQTECHNCPMVKEYPKSILLDRTKQMFQMKKELLSNLDMTIAVPSQWLADRVKLSFLKDKPIKVIRNGIDTNIFHPVDASDLKRELKIPSEHKVILAAAPDIMSERKGGKWVLKLAEEMKEEQVRFVLLGGVEDDQILDGNIPFEYVIERAIVSFIYYSAWSFYVFRRNAVYHEMA